MRIANYLNHTILLDPLLGPKPVVLDCGSNEGEFAAWAHREFGARVYGYEPDSRLYAELERKQHPDVTFFCKAIAGKKGTAQFHLRASKCSSLHYGEPGGGDTEVVETATLSDEFARLGLKHVDLLKMDIEGAELDVLQTTPPETLQRINQISVEFHDFIRPDDRPTIRAIIRRLRDFGFTYLPFSTYTYGDVLFVNPRITMTAWQQLGILTRGKLIPGMKRTTLRPLSRHLLAR
ncbi:MAG: hypothetical protein DCC67_11990 [Planctomycetota bacterium]|nr:MAG: hypothetical protein DCC67_11990 [Planctomycetota bacterium]